MKRLERNPEKFEALEVFTAFSREHGYKLRSQEDTEKFLQVFRDTLKVSQENTILLHGKRMESCFGQVVAGLHGCRLIKTEDIGDVIYDDDEIKLPDYRLILKDGRQVFVEVKNCNHSNPKASYFLTKNYVEKLQRYSEINQIPLFFAIYYRCLRMWTLLPVTSFIERKTKYETCALHSLGNSEMAMLGDVMIATKPPLIIELVADNTQEISINDDNYAHFVCGDVKMYCDGEEIIDHNEKNIAFYLMRFGQWECGEPEAVMTQSNTLQSVRYSFVPQSMEGFEKNGFSILGNLSSMITEAFNEHTVYEQEVTAITSGAEPDVFSVKIPVDYKGSVLGLWRFPFEANPDFKVGENRITE
ncbi:hypothetical protein I8254_17275 [Providencia rettgeri]|uniref:Endonuclease n=1 Tax=Providencia rettgeri TaxID=587 RepID=A0A220DIN1_PRORE|nr:hypothetical protein [Providencia rettgeri]ARV76125.1 hypothetical protein PRE19P2_0380 [Providencia rettgeri]MBJ9972750.1 hypothetical protein [Providencia rettgeri]MCB6146806.1 hypothetical protein [Providencia rettgeri]MCF8961385.1 hypothetical protein [Providencia rettgeri]